MAELGPCRVLPTLRHVIKRRMSTLSQLTTPYITESNTKSFDEIPGPTGIHRWPVIGTFLNFYPFTEHTAENTYQLLRNMYVKYGPVFRLQLGRDTVVLTEPKDVDTVYRHEGRCPLRPNLSLREVYSRRTGTKLRDVSML
ncbi:hypothetical protein Btru_044593 [Bulinus truncatus]|nr:hypothetical protein Btru_044593 [Bulinus truncatus]